MTIKLYSIFLLSFLISCQVNKQKTATFSPNLGNNKVKTDPKAQSNGNAEVVFLGRNNAVVFKEKNTQNNAVNSQDALIISGDSNRIEVNIADFTNNSTNSQDTTVIVGSRNLVRINQQRIVDKSLGSDQNRIVFANGRMIEFTDKDIVDDARLSDLEFAITTDDTFAMTDKAERIYENKAQSGNPKHQFLLAKIYEFQGKCAKSAHFFQLSADQNYLEALVHLGDVYTYGYCTAKIDTSKALELYKKAANLGNDYAKSMVIWLSQ